MGRQQGYTKQTKKQKRRAAPASWSTPCSRASTVREQALTKGPCRQCWGLAYGVFAAEHLPVGWEPWDEAQSFLLLPCLSNAWRGTNHPEAGLPSRIGWLSPPLPQSAPWAVPGQPGLVLLRNTPSPCISGLPPCRHSTKTLHRVGLDQNTSQRWVGGTRVGERNISILLLPKNICPAMIDAVSFPAPSSSLRGCRQVGSCWLS